MSEAKNSHGRLIQTADQALKVRSSQETIGVDQLSMTPADNFGHDKLTVIVEHFSKHVRLYITDNHAGQTLAQHLYDHYCTWRRYDTIITDPGSNLTSEDVEQLNKWIGIVLTKFTYNFDWYLSFSENILVHVVNFRSAIYLPLIL
jgi:hypothetical protein